MGLGLEANTDVFDGTGDDTVCDSSGSTSKVVLAVGQVLTLGVFDGIVGGNTAAGFVEGTELDRNTGPNTD